MPPAHVGTNGSWTALQTSIAICTALFAASKTFVAIFRQAIQYRQVLQLEQTDSTPLPADVLIMSEYSRSSREGLRSIRGLCLSRNSIRSRLFGRKTILLKQPLPFEESEESLSDRAVSEIAHRNPKAGSSRNRLPVAISRMASHIDSTSFFLHAPQARSVMQNLFRQQYGAESLRCESH